MAWQGFCVDYCEHGEVRSRGGIMAKPTTGESASVAMARHKAVMAQREKALNLMARQAAARKAEFDKANSEKPVTRQPAHVVRVGSSVRTVHGGLPSLRKYRWPTTWPTRLHHPAVTPLRTACGRPGAQFPSDQPVNPALGAQKVPGSVHSPRRSSGAPSPGSRSTSWRSRTPTTPSASDEARRGRRLAPLQPTPVPYRPEAGAPSETAPALVVRFGPWDMAFGRVAAAVIDAGR